MGTEVQCESYLLGCPSVRNSNEDSSISWPPYYQNRALTEHLYDSVMLRSVNESSGYDKEMLKQTMLEHEAIFRKQVCELHRLYRIQRDLMDELAKKEIYKLSIQSRTTQSYLFSPIRAPENIERIWQMKEAVTGIEDVKPSLDLLKDMGSSREKGVSLKDSEFPGCKLKTLPKQMLDLRLPADVYINVEDSDRIEKEDIGKPFCWVRDNLNLSCDIEPDNDVKLTIGSRENCNEVGWNSNPTWQNGQSIRRLNYLNVFEGAGCEGKPDLVCNFLLCAKTTPKEFRGHQLPATLSGSFLHEEFLTEKHGDLGNCPDICNGDKGKGVEEWPSFNSKAGRSGKRVSLFNPGLSSDQCPIPSEASKPKIEKEHSLPYDHCETQNWLEGKPTVYSGPYQRSSPFADSNDSELTHSEIPDPFSVVSCSEYMICEPAIVSAKRKPPPRVITLVPIAVQALPCFTAPEMMKCRGRKPKVLGQSSTNKSSPDQNGFYQDLSSDSVSATQFKHSSDISVYEKSRSYASKKLPKLLQTGTNGNEKLESSECCSWFKTKPFGTDSQVEFTVSTDLNRSLENFPSFLQVKKKRNRNLNHVGTKKILGQNALYSLPNLNTLDVSTEEDEVQNINAKIIHDIDFEIPLTPDETSDTLAADNLIVMSLGLTEQLATDSCDLLHWFANVVSSEGAVNGNGDDQVDVFEVSTLQLEEMNPDEYLPPPQEPEDQKDEKDTGTTSRLLTKTRRGQLRKRRQKKDFQKDILLGLVSLSRHEVTEDLQAFDCLMRAMGEDWQCNLTRRVTGVRSVQGKGRRVPRNVVVSGPPPTLEEPEVSQNPKIRIIERCIVGWGKTTRRGRRPRVRRGAVKCA